MKINKTRVVRFLAIHKIAAALGDRKCKALRGFHAYTGCDTASFFVGKGKKTAWKVWMSNDEATQAFIELGKDTPVVNNDLLQRLEAFVVRLYQGDTKNVNELRKYLFVGDNRSLFTIPPTAAALHQHALRAAYQAGVVWGRCLAAGDVPGPSSWGWEIRDGAWVPIWTALPHIWNEARQKDNCGCKTGCTTKRCSCVAAKLPCWVSCKGCRGRCENARYEKYNQPRPL